MFIQSEDIPELYTKVLSAELVQYITTVVGTTKLVRSALGTIKGKWAVALTVAIGAVVGEVQLVIFGDHTHLMGLGAGLLGGAAAAGVFRLAKMAGRKVNIQKS